MLYLYSLLLVALSVYSYSLIDLNLTLFNFPQWQVFREWVIQLGYYNRELSSLIFSAIIVLLFFFYWYFVKNYKRYSPLKIAVVSAGILFFSYPFLSHDLFNYMFDAKILTVYHQNPYMYKPMDFVNDDWLRFMHWVHRTYPYGPTFLPLTLIPAFLGMGKFILMYAFFKVFFLSFYIAAVHFVSKLEKRWGMIIAASPLIVIEGLVSLHNDLLSLSLGLIGIYFLFKSKGIVSRLLFLLSGGIKYLTLPILLLTKHDSLQNKVILGIIVALIGYLSLTLEIQPWYFLSLFLFLPYYEKWFGPLHIFFFGLLMSYYPYVRLGGWDTVDKIQMKHTIILIFVVASVLWLAKDLVLKKALWKR